MQCSLAALEEWNPVEGDQIWRFIGLCILAGPTQNRPVKPQKGEGGGNGQKWEIACQSYQSYAISDKDYMSKFHLGRYAWWTYLTGNPKINCRQR